MKPQKSSRKNRFPKSRPVIFFRHFFLSGYVRPVWWQLRQKYFLSTRTGRRVSRRSRLPRKVSVDVLLHPGTGDKLTRCRPAKKKNGKAANGQIFASKQKKLSPHIETIADVCPLSWSTFGHGGERPMADPETNSSHRKETLGLENEIPWEGLCMLQEPKIHFKPSSTTGHSDESIIVNLTHHES